MRVILHADMDAFFASVEQRDDPSIRGRPVVVGGTSSRGVVSAASYEAREYGIRSAMPTVHARKLCPDAVFLSGDMPKYVRESRGLFEIFRRFTPLVEGISLDEAFLDLTGTERLFGPADQVAVELRRAVRDETGLAVSAGVAPIKMVAKLASESAKPDGVCIVPPDSVQAFLDPLPVGRIWGVGPVARARLVALGIRTIGDLGRIPDPEIRQILGRQGPGFARLARGDDAREVEPDIEPRSYGEENTFAVDVSDRGLLRRAIRAHAEAVARRLRRDGVCGRGVQLKLKLARSLGGGRFPLLTRSVTLPTATDDGARIATAATRLLDRSGVDAPIRLLGVSVSRLESAETRQLSLLTEDGGRGRRRRLNHVVDDVHRRFGREALSRAGEGIDRAGLSLTIKSGDDG